MSEGHKLDRRERYIENAQKPRKPSINSVSMARQQEVLPPNSLKLDNRIGDKQRQEGNKKGRGCGLWQFELKRENS